MNEDRRMIFYLIRRRQPGIINLVRRPSVSDTCMFMYGCQILLREYIYIYMHMVSLGKFYLHTPLCSKRPIFLSNVLFQFWINPYWVIPKAQHIWFRESHFPMGCSWLYYTIWIWCSLNQVWCVLRISHPYYSTGVSFFFFNSSSHFFSFFFFFHPIYHNRILLFDSNEI